MATEDTGNLDIQRQINELLEARTALMSKQNEILRSQIQISEKLAELLDKGAKKPEGIDSMSASLNEAAEAARTASAGIEGVTASATEAAKKIPDVGTTAASAAKTGRTAFQKFKDVLGGVVGVVGSITRAFTGIAGGLLSIPMGILSSLQEEAADLANRSIELLKAQEEVRDKFGSLASNEGKAVMDSYKGLQKQSDNLAGSGRSLASIYGSGPEGLAQAMQELSATAEAMGPVFSALGNQMAEHAAEVLVYQKGLGITNEAMKDLGATALARGENITDSLKEIGNLSVQMGQKFGISSKLMGKDMTYMTSNMGKFGSMTKAQMATSAVFVRKLGLEIKDLEGLMGAFDDFETAATNASKLAQSFGMNVDAMQMMKEQDPAKRLDMLRQSFAATGKSIKDMTRQEKELLAQTAGMDANMVEAALSAENMGMSYDEISAAAEGAADKQLSQEEIMQNMADNIKKVFEPIEYLGSLFKTFFDGFTNGVMKAKPMRELLHSIMEALKAVSKLGRLLGRVFVEAFPGVKEILGGVSGFFKDITKSVNSVTKDVRGFKSGLTNTFKDLQKDPEKYINKFTDFISKSFEKIFGGKGGRGSQILDGLATFGSFLIKGLIALIPKLISGLTGMVKKITEWLRGANTGPSILAPLIDGIKETLPDLLSALWGLFVEAFKALAPILIPILGAYIGFILLKAAMSAVGSAVISKVTSMITKALGVDAGGKEKEKPLSEKFVDAAKAIKGVIKELADVSLKQVGMALLVMTALTAFMIGALVAFAYAVATAAKAFAGVTWEQVGMTLTSMVTAVVATSLIAKIAEKIDPKQVLKGTAGLVVAGVFVAGAIWGFAEAIKKGVTAMKGVTWPDVELLFEAVGLALLATLVVAGISAALGMAGAPVLAAGMLGLVLAGAFVLLGIVGFAYAIAEAIKVIKAGGTSSLDEATQLFDVMGLAAESLLKLAVTAMVLTTATPAMLAGMITLPIAAEFLKKGVTAFSEAIGSLLIDASPFDTTKVEQILKTTGMAILAIAGMSAVSAAMVGLGPLVIVLLAGMSIASKFFKAAIVDLVDAMDAIDKIKLTDPDMMQKKLEIIGSLIKSVSDLGNLAISAGQLDNASKALDPKAQGAIKMMGEFISGLKTTIVELITTLAGLAVNWKKKDLEKISSMGSLIGSIAQLAGALVGPLGEMAKIQSDERTWYGGKGGPDAVEKINTVSNSLGTIIKSIKDNLIPLVKDIAGIQLPAGTDKNKAEIISTLLSSISSVANAMTEITKIDPKVLGNNSILKTTLIDFTWPLSYLKEFMPKYVGYIDEFTAYKDKTLAPLVTAIVEDIKTVNTALESLGDIKMDATIEKIGKDLGIKDSVIKLERKPITMNVQLNLTMKAEDIAKEIFDVSAKMVNANPNDPAVKNMAAAYGVSPK